MLPHQMFTPQYKEARVEEQACVAKMEERYLPTLSPISQLVSAQSGFRAAF